MSGLFGNRVDIGQVLAVETPDPTDTHIPIGHGVFVALFKSALKDLGMAHRTMDHVLARQGAQYFGLAEIVTDGDYRIVVGIRNSHDKSIAAGAVLGSNVIVCSNLCFSGEVRMDRKHTVHFLDDLPELMHGALSKIEAMKDIQARRLDKYKRVIIGDIHVSHFLIMAVEAGIIPNSYIPFVLREWRKPSYDEHLVGGNTVWRLMQAFTQVQKVKSPAAGIFELPAKQIKLHEMLDDASQLDLTVDINAIGS